MSQIGEHIGTLALSIPGLESQGNRLLRMHFPPDDGPAGTVMLANSIKARAEEVHIHSKLMLPMTCT